MLSFEFSLKSSSSASMESSGWNSNPFDFKRTKKWTLNRKNLSHHRSIWPLAAVMVPHNATRKIFDGATTLQFFLLSGLGTTERCPHLFIPFSFLMSNFDIPKGYYRHFPLPLAHLDPNVRFYILDKIKHQQTQLNNKTNKILSWKHFLSAFQVVI